MFSCSSNCSFQNFFISFSCLFFSFNCVFLFYNCFLFFQESLFFTLFFRLLFSLSTVSFCKFLKSPFVYLIFFCLFSVSWLFFWLSKNYFVFYNLFLELNSFLLSTFNNFFFLIFYNILFCQYLFTFSRV